MSRSLYVLLEGSDDDRFFNYVFKPELSKIYNKIVKYQYAQRSKKNVDRLMHTLKHSGYEYVVFSDFDRAQCVTASKEALQKRIPVKDAARIAVAKMEVESWYLAGLDHSSTRKLHIPFYANTEDISKEQFETNRPKDSLRIPFMIEVLKLFDIDTAKKQNHSFRYVWSMLASGANN